MSERLLLVDNDIFTLLAAAGRLGRVGELLGFPPPQLRRLPPLMHMLRARASGRSKRRFKEYPDPAIEAAVQECERVAELVDRPESDEQYSRLLQAIDEGEAQLYAIVAERPITWLASGDTAAMKGLSTAPELVDIRKAVSGRVVTVEAAIYKLIEADGFSRTAEAFNQLRFHKTVRSILPDEKNPDPLQGPRSYLRDLCRSLGRGFLHCPPCPDAAAGACALDGESPQ